MIDVALIARTQTDGGAFGLQSGGRASAGVAGDSQQIVGVGEFGIPIEHALKVEHHVGQALYFGMANLRDAVLKHGHVIAQPQVARIEGGGVPEFGRGLCEFVVLDVVPGKYTMGQSVADRIAGKLVGIFAGSLLFFSGFEFLIGRGGGGGQGVQFLQAEVAALGDADCNLKVKGARIGLGQRLRCDGRIFRRYGNGEAVSLAGRGIRSRSGVRISLPGGIDRGEQRGLTVEVILHRLFQLRGVHAVGFLNCIFHRDVLVQDQVEVGSSLGQLLFVKQVVHHDPRFRIVERVAVAFVTTRSVVLHREEVWQGKPDLGAEQFGEGFGRMRLALVAEQILCR